MNYDAENIYLKALIGMIAKRMCKEVFVEEYKRCGGCVNEKIGQQCHNYCQLVDPITKVTECLDGVFSRVDIYLANELCFEKVQDLIPIPVRDIDLYINRKKHLDNLNWMNELLSNYIDLYS